MAQLLATLGTALPLFLGDGASFNTSPFGQAELGGSIVELRSGVTVPPGEYWALKLTAGPRQLDFRIPWLERFPALTSLNEWFACERGGEDAWCASQPADDERSTAMLARWNPFNSNNGRIARSPSPMPAFDDLFREADTLMRGAFFNDLAFPSNWATAASFSPAADIVETDDELQLKLDLPGHDAKNLQVSLEGDTLTVRSERKQETKEERKGVLRAERSYGMFSRSFVLPKTVDAQRGEAKYEHGVLTVTLPKREDAKPKTITIKVES